MKALIRIIQVLLTIVWLGLLALCLLLFRSTHGNGLPGIGDWRGYIVADNNMSPELSPGDLAVIHMGEAPKAGDAVLCASSASMPELTRIIGTSDGQLILKPDGSDESRLASMEEIEGVFSGYIPGFGEPFRFLSSITGAIVIFITGLILIVLPGSLLRAPKDPRPDRQSAYTPRH